MNIWEAYQHLKEGRVIVARRGEEEDNYISYVFRTEEIPIGKIRYKVVAESTFSEGERPEKLADFSIEDLEEVCITSFQRDDFECMTMDALLKHAQKAWDEENDE